MPRNAPDPEVIAFYLHDGVLAPLGACVSRLEELHDTCSEEWPAEAREALGSAVTLITAQYRQVREELPLLAEGLIPTPKDRTSVWLKSFLSRTLRIETHVTSLTLLDRLADQQTSDLRLLLTELVCNMVKHAHPTTVSIAATYVRPQLEISIEHDGGVYQSSPHTGIGTSSMAVRAKALAASIDFPPPMGPNRTVVRFLPDAAYARSESIGIESIPA